MSVSEVFKPPHTMDSIPINVRIIVFLLTSHGRGRLPARTERVRSGGKPFATVGNRRALGCYLCTSVKIRVLLIKLYFKGSQIVISQMNRVPACNRCSGNLKPSATVMMCNLNNHNM